MGSQSKITPGDPLSSFAVPRVRACIFINFGGPNGAIRALCIRGLHVCVIFINFGGRERGHPGSLRRAVEGD